MAAKALGDLMTAPWRHRRGDRTCGAERAGAQRRMGQGVEGEGRALTGCLWAVGTLAGAVAVVAVVLANAVVARVAAAAEPQMGRQQVH